MILAGNIRVREDTISEYESGLGEYLGAVATDTFLDMPIPAIARQNEIARMQRRQADDADPLTREVPIDEARNRVKESGLESTLKLPEQPTIRQGVLDIMLSRAEDRRKREATIARGPGGFVPGALAVGTSLAAGLADPLNIASAFIPVVGQARYARMVGQATTAIGRAGVRAGVGAVEGAAGAALLEPLTYLANTTEGQDYEMADALRNIAFGTAFGGGLHVIGGAALDLFRKPGLPRSAVQLAEDLPPRAREDAMAVAIADLVEGQDVRAGELIELGAMTDPKIAAAIDVSPASLARRGSPETPASPPVAVAPPADDAKLAFWLDQVRLFEEGPKVKAGSSLFWFIKNVGGIRTNDIEGGEVRAVLQDARFPPGMVSNKKGRNADDVALLAWEAGYIGTKGGDRPTLQDLYDAMETEARGRKVYALDDRGDQEDYSSWAEGMDRLYAEAGIAAGTPREDAARMLMDYEREMNGAQAARRAGVTEEGFAKPTRLYDDPEEIARSRAADALPESLAMRRLAEARAAAEEELRIAREMFDALDIPESEISAMTERLAAIDAAAKDQAAAYRAGAECLMGSDF